MTRFNGRCPALKNIGRAGLGGARRSPILGG
jgi:hypothetical protein